MWNLFVKGFEVVSGAQQNICVSLSPPGNHMLLRVLPSVYPKQPDTIHHHLGNLTAMMPQLESTEQQHLIRLIQMVAEQHPLVSFCADELTIYCV